MAKSKIPYTIKTNNKGQKVMTIKMTNKDIANWLSPLLVKKK